MSKKGWIGFDLDGTLAHYEGWIGIEHIGKPIQPMGELLKKFIAEDQPVKIFTARVYRRHEWLAMDPLYEESQEKRIALQKECELVEATIWNWLAEQGLPKLPITCVKDFRMIQLYDDRCVQVETNTGRIIE